MPAFEYLGAAVTLAAAIIGILGKTTDDTKQGLAHLTPRGWAMLVFAVLGGLVSAVAIARGNDEKRQAEQQRERLRLIALEETEWALGPSSGRAAPSSRLSQAGETTRCQAPVLITLTWRSCCVWTENRKTPSATAPRDVVGQTRTGLRLAFFASASSWL